GTSAYSRSSGPPKWVHRMAFMNSPYDHGTARVTYRKWGIDAFTLPISPGISMTSGAWGESMKTNAWTIPLALAALTGLLTVAFAQQPAKQKSPAAKSEPKQGKQAAPPPAPGGGQPTLLGQFGEWGAYAANSGGKKICYALAKPSSSATEPANRPRDPA